MEKYNKSTIFSLVRHWIRRSCYPVCTPCNIISSIARLDYTYAHDYDFTVFQLQFVRDMTVSLCLGATYCRPRTSDGICFGEVHRGQEHPCAKAKKKRPRDYAAKNFVPLNTLGTCQGQWVGLGNVPHHFIKSIYTQGRLFFTYCHNSGCLYSNSVPTSRRYGAATLLFALVDRFG